MTIETSQILFSINIALDTLVLSSLYLMSMVGRLKENPNRVLTSTYSSASLSLSSNEDSMKPQSLHSKPVDTIRHTGRTVSYWFKEQLNTETPHIKDPAP